MTTSDFAIETAGLTRYFGKKKAVDSLTLQVPRGSIFAFLGRSGSGKTTTIRMLLGFLRPTFGNSSVLGHDSRKLTPALRGRIGYIAESHPAHEWMTVAQEAWFASGFTDHWNTKLFKSIIGQFRLSPDARVRDLSRGERAGLSLAITFAAEPELLILDDPAIGLDPIARRTLIHTFLDLTRGSGRTVLFSTHQLDDVERMADYAAVLDQSTLRITGSVEDVTASVRRYRLVFAPGAMPAGVPSIRGLLSAERHDGTLILFVQQPGDDTTAAIAGLGAMTVEDRPVSVADAFAAYLGARGDDPAVLEETATFGAGGS